MEVENDGRYNKIDLYNAPVISGIQIFQNGHLHNFILTNGFSMPLFSLPIEFEASHMPLDYTFKFTIIIASCPVRQFSRTMKTRVDRVPGRGFPS